MRHTLIDKRVDVTLDLCPVGDRRIAELSFKARDWKAAGDTRQRLQAFLDEKGLSLHEDSLKTQAILDGFLAPGGAPSAVGS